MMTSAIPSGNVTKPDIEDSDGPWESLMLVISVGLVGYSIQLNDGNLSPGAIACLAGSILAMLAAYIGPQTGLLPKMGWLAPRLGLMLVLAFQFVQFFMRPAADQLITTPTGLKIFSLLLLVSMGLSVAVFSFTGRFIHMAMAGIILCHLAMGWCVLRASKDPGIDVFTIQRDSAVAFLSGKNPYSITFPNIYAPQTHMYPRGWVLDGRLQFGYPYLPTTLLMSLPGQMAGDYRLAQMAAIVLSGAFIAWCTPGLLSKAAAILFLFTPRSFFVLEAGWTEPFLVLLFSITVFCACRLPRLFPILLGLFLAGKQYTIVLLPLVLLTGIQPWSWKNIWRIIWQSTLTAAMVTLPFVLWDQQAFIHSVVDLHRASPWRPDSLGFPAWWYSVNFEQLGGWIILPAMAFGVLMAIFFASRTPAGFAGAASLLFLLTFAFGKQAFCNYYYLLVIAMLCCALAAMDTKPRTFP